MALRRKSVMLVGLSSDELSIRDEDAGAHVTLCHVDDFQQALRELATRPPDVLITTLRLGMYNGLHLVLRGKAVHPEMAALVVADTDDAVLRRDAEQLGARFTGRPTAEDLRAALADPSLNGS